MSYVRFGSDGSDVYVYEGERGIECCGCRLVSDPGGLTPLEAYDHLQEHVRAGHCVPLRVLAALLDEATEGPRQPPTDAEVCELFQAHYEALLRELLAPRRPLFYDPAPLADSDLAL